jgi:8-oxo-dGTP pyrophosphatase MutT (NUDIX family)
MPPVSEKQRKAMYAAAEGKSTLGIPKKVGEEFVGADATNGNAAGVIFVAPDGDILLMRRSADEKNYGGWWGLPGGKAEAGEEPLAAARREVKEETGFDCSKGLLKIFDSVVTPNKMAFHTYASGVDEKFAPKMADGEHQGYAWFSLDGLPAKTHPSIVRALKERLDLADDMAPEDWDGLRNGFAKWTREEEGEPEHAEDAKLEKVEVDYSEGKGEDRCKHCNHFEKPNACEIVEGRIDPEYWCKRFERVGTAQDDEHGKLNEKERAEADRNHKSREEMPGSAFLEPEGHKYPVKTKVDGEWKYSRDLLLAAAREARMHGHEELAKRADAIRERMSSGANDELALDWAIKVEGIVRPTISSAIVFDRKESVRTYDDDGRMHVAKTNISKANVCEYQGREIPDFEKLGLDPDKLYKLYRHPDELKKAAASFNNIPLLGIHTPVDAIVSGNHKPEHVVGSTGTDAKFEHPYLTNSLVVWSKDAINEIEDELKKELSSAYRYRADMSPGKTPDGEEYDGVMRDISGNHVAVVREGRAGPDVLVADSKEGISMSKVKMTRTGAAVRSVIALHIQPRLAQDAKVDLRPILAKLTAKNFAAQKPVIIKALDAAAKGKLAKDASLDDVTGLLDALEKAEVAKGEDEIDVEDMPEETMDAEGGGLREFLKGKLGEDDYAKACDMMNVRGAADADETEEEKAERERKEKEAKDKAAHDAEEKEKETAKAMDAKIDAAVKAERKRAQDTAEAREEVRPYVGTLKGAFDSAEGVYQAALGVLGVADADKITGIPALKAVLAAHQSRNTVAAKPSMATDAATQKSLAERFPHAAKIKVSA